jgi:thiosulfate dehydrogenase [quinone] large subunit
MPGISPDKGPPAPHLSSTALRNELLLYPFVVPVLKGFVLPFAKPIAFLVAYGELAIGLGLVLGILVRPASVCGFVYMLALLFSSNYPGPQAPF